MRIVINGTENVFQIKMTVDALLDRLCLDKRKIAVERNGEIVPKTEFASTDLCDGDEIEIVHFIGGGASELQHGGNNFEK